MEKIDKLIMKYLVMVLIASVIFLNWHTLGKFVYHFWQILGPLVKGCILAYILNLLMVRIEGQLVKVDFFKKKPKLVRPVGIITSFLTFILVVMFVLVLVLPQFAAAIAKFIEVIPAASSAIQQWVEDYDEYFPQVAKLMDQLSLDWKSIFQQMMNVVNTVGSNVVNSVIGFASGLMSNVVNGIVSLMVSLYLLGGKETLAAQGKRLLAVFVKEHHADEFLYVLTVLHDSFSNFFVGMTIEGVIYGTLVTIAGTVAQMPYAGMLGVISGVFALVPILGGYMSAALGALFLLAVSPNQALIYLIMVTVIQQIEGNLIYPRVVGGSIGLPGLWVLVSVTIGGGLLGITGMLIGIPLAATLYKLLACHVKSKERQLSV